MGAIHMIQGIVAASSGGGGNGGGGGGGASYGSWTVQWWMKKLSPQVSTVGRVFSVGVDTSASIGYSNESGGDYVWTNGGTGPLTVGSITNQWVHISINSDGTNLYVYKNGQQLTVTARTGAEITDASTQFWMGGDTNSHWKGRIADFNIVKGNCLYTSTYTPPTRITTAPSGTVFMQVCDPSVQTGPSFSGSSNFSNVADDPWGDGLDSVEFTGYNTSFIRWDGNSIFALDAA
jgi:hypothetical protein